MVCVKKFEKDYLFIFVITNKEKGVVKSTPWCETVFSHHGCGFFLLVDITKEGPTGPTN